MPFEQETKLRLPMQNVPLYWNGTEFVPWSITDGVINVRQVIVTGSSTEVNNSGLTDDMKDFAADLLNGKTIIVKHGGVDYYRLISDTAGSDLTFDALIPEVPEVPAIPAQATVGAEPGGIISIAVAAPGAAGNAYSVQVVDGEGESQDMTVAFADNLLLITSATNSEGVVQPITAGGLVTLINTDGVVSELFLASQDFTAGNIAAMETAISFAGGEDVVPAVPAVVAEVGDEYEIIL